MKFDYHLDNVNDRLQLLLTVLQYDTEETVYFNIWERMQINQERASMLSFKSYLFNEIKHEDIRWFNVPESIEEKIQTIAKTIELRNWQPKPKED